MADVARDKFACVEDEDSINVVGGEFWIDNGARFDGVDGGTNGILCLLEPIFQKQLLRVVAQDDVSEQSRCEGVQ